VETYNYFLNSSLFPQVLSHLVLSKRSKIGFARIAGVPWLPALTVSAAVGKCVGLWCGAGWEPEEGRGRKVWLVAHGVGSRAVCLSSWRRGEEDSAVPR